MLGNGLCVREHNRETNRDIFITCEDKEFPEKGRDDYKKSASNGRIL